ncbi:MAG: hypothetical protein ACJ780_12485 [Solirubrobacteraceae bacterium]
MRLARLTLHLNVQRHWALVTLALVVGCAGLNAARVARGQAYPPPPGKIFQGVAGTPIASYERAVGKHPAVFQIFSAWGEWVPGMFADAAAAHSRLMLHITTASGAREMITPQGIADGEGDAWLIELNNAIATSGHPVYVRLMAEMDNANNPYAAYNTDGSSRSRAHSSRAFVLAWKRATLILRGGSLTRIDATLHRLGLPELHAHSDLPVGQVAMMWVPQVAGLPDVSGNQPRDYWPGRAWVDWVGTDFYAKFPNWSGLSGFYRAFGGAPFVFGEYALWGSDDPGWVTSLFGWVRSHPRTRMLVYNLGVDPHGPFRLSLYPASDRALRSALASSRYPAFAPDWQN